MTDSKQMLPRDTTGTTRSKKITEVKAARLVAAIAALKECDDITNDLSLALDDVRAAISPWYDR